jgi:tetratricopeptide (TPR) repeat protein
MTLMRIVLSVLLVLPLTLGPTRAADPDLAASYYHFTLARAYSQDKRYSDALEEFKKAIALNPTSSELRVQHALTLYEATYIREFVEECQKAIEIDPQDPAPHFLLGRYYFTYRDGNQTNLMDKAAAEFERVIELDPNHVMALDFLSRLFFMKEQWGKAAETLDRLTDLNPGYAHAHYLRAFALVRMDRPEEAIAILERAVSYQAADVDHFKLLGGLYLQQREVPKAIQALGRAVEMDRRGEDPSLRLELAKALKAGRRIPEAVELLTAVIANRDELEFEATFELAEGYRLMGRRAEATERYQRLLEMKQVEAFRPMIQNRLALVYQEARQYDKAIELLRQVAEAEPDKVESNLSLVYALKEGGRYEEALVLADRLLARWPNDTYVTVAKSQILGAMGQTQKGIELLKESGFKQEDPEPFILAASQLFIDDKKYDDAEKIVKQGLAKRPESESMYFQLGAIYERQEKYRVAEENFKRVLDKNPSHAGVLNYLGYMLADRGVRLDEALGYIQKAVELDPYNGAYLDSLGWAYFKLKQYEPAERYLRQAAELNDSDPTILEHLGDLYEKLGRFAEAGEYYEKSMAVSKEKEERKRVQSKLTSVKKELSERRR